MLFNKAENHFLKLIMGLLADLTEMEKETYRLG